VDDEYKGINSHWRAPDGGQIFEVQFHTRASFEAKQETHWAYERLRALPDDEAEVRQLRAFQRQVTAQIPHPPGAAEIPDYRYPQEVCDADECHLLRNRRRPKQP
jgi:hypothetical protein